MWHNLDLTWVILTFQLVSIGQNDIADGVHVVNLLDEECLGHLMDHVHLTKVLVSLGPYQAIPGIGGRGGVGREECGEKNVRVQVWVCGGRSVGRGM